MLKLLQYCNYIIIVMQIKLMLLFLLLLYHFKDFLCNSSIVIIRDRSLFIAWGLGGGGFWGGITWFVGEQKGGSFVTENPKEGITENFGRIQRGATQICLENGDMGGGNRESHQMLLEGSLQWSNIQRGDRQNFTLFSPKSSLPLHGDK